MGSSLTLCCGILLLLFSARLDRYRRYPSAVRQPRQHESVPVNSSGAVCSSSWRARKLYAAPQKRFD